MDVRKGVKRLALAVGIPYFGWWALVAFLNYDHAMSSEDWRLQAAANENLNAAILWGLVVPILLLIVSALGYWVYRGFKSKP